MKKNLEIHCLGHACFSFKYMDYTIVIDPYENGSVPGLIFPIGNTANKVLVSHSHKDHCAIHQVNIVEKDMPKNIKISSFSCFHDNSKGQLRGENLVHILEFDDIKIAHLGDIGEMLNSSQKDLLFGADIVFAPINGFYTLGAKEIIELYKEIDPKILVPMHYFKDGKGYLDSGQIEVFTSAFALNQIDFLPSEQFVYTKRMKIKPILIFK